MIHYQWHWFRRWRERRAERAWYAENRRWIAQHAKASPFEALSFRPGAMRPYNPYLNYTQIVRDSFGYPPEMAHTEENA